MTLGFSPLSTVPISSLAESVNFSTDSNFLRLLNSYSTERVFLLEIDGVEYYTPNKVYNGDASAAQQQESFTYRLFDNQTNTWSSYEVYSAGGIVENFSITNSEGYTSPGCFTATIGVASLDFGDNYRTPVDLTKEYKFSIAVKTSNPTTSIRLGYKCIDKWGDVIPPYRSWRDQGKDTVLAVSAVAGTDTVFITPAVEPWFTVATPFSYLQFNPTDTIEDIPSNAEVYQISNINTSTNPWTITLARNLELDFNAGTPVGNSTSGSTYMYAIGPTGAFVPTSTWYFEEVNLTGTTLTDADTFSIAEPSRRMFRRGTKYILPSITLVNQGDTVFIDDISLREKVTTLRLSDIGYTSDTYNYPARVSDPYTFETKLFEDNYLSGNSKISYGNIAILNNDGELDHILDQYWDNATVKVKLGARYFTLPEFGTIFIGKVEQATWDEYNINLRLRDFSALLEADLNQTLYLGTGGLEGTSEMKGIPKPLCYGECKNIEPVLVDPVLLDYQIHDGKINAVDAVYFNGNLATITTDYTVNLNTGIIRLTGRPLGDASVIVTADVKGYMDDTEYYDSTVDIIEHILKNKSILTYPDDFDTLSFSDTLVQNSEKVGIYITEIQSVTNILDTLMTSIGGYWDITRLNKIRIGIVAEPGTPIHSFNKSNILSIKRLATPIQAWKVISRYLKNWKVFSTDQLAGNVSDPEVIRLTSEDKQVIIEDTNLKTPLSVIRDIESLYILEDSAEAEANRQFDLFSQKRDVYEIVTKNLNFQIKLGDNVSVAYNRFGLEQGRDFLVIGYRESIKSNQLTLTLWG